MVETLSNLLRSVVALSPADLLPVLYLSLNRLGPPQQGLELGIGEGILLKAVAQATGEAWVVDTPGRVGGASREDVERPGDDGEGLGGSTDGLRVEGPDGGGEIRTSSAPRPGRRGGGFRHRARLRVRAHGGCRGP